MPVLIRATGLAPNSAGPSSLRRAAETLESAFLSEMLKSAQIFKASQLMGGGAGEEQFTSFLADEHARAIVERGGIGLADVIEARLRSQAQGL